MTTKFDRETAIQLIGNNTFAAQIYSSWWVGAGPNGGYVAALLLRALQQTVANDAWQPISLTIHYTAPPAEGACQVVTNIERAGRTLTTLSARLTQQGRLCALAVAAFSLPRSESLHHETSTMPAVPPPEQVPALTLPQSVIPPFANNYEYRWAIGDLPFSGSTQARVGGWVRLTEPRPTDALLAVAFLDGWIPVVYPLLSQPAPAPTIDLTIHFRARLPLPNQRDDGFALCVFSSQLAAGGYFEENGELWSAEGVLLAQSRQLALITII